MKTDYRQAECDIILKSCEFLKSLELAEIEEYSHPVTGNQIMLICENKKVDIKNIIFINLDFFSNCIYINTNTVEHTIVIRNFMKDGSVY